MRTIKASELQTLDTFKTGPKARRELTVKRINVVDETWQAPESHLGKLIIWTYQTGCKQFILGPDDELILLHRIGEYKPETLKEPVF